MRKIISLFAAVLCAAGMFAYEMSCADAAAAALNGSTDEVTVTGYVTEIASPWSSTYKNISFWMADQPDGGNVIQAYRCVCENETDAPVAGNIVKVTGKLHLYNETPELNANCTFEMINSGVPDMGYYVVGNMNDWLPVEAYRLWPAPAQEYVGEFNFAAGDEFKILYSDGVTVAQGEAYWFPQGGFAPYKITESGFYTVHFRPEGGVEGWYGGVLDVVKNESVVDDWAVIFWEEPADPLPDGSRFVVPGTGFAAETTDPDSKMKVDENKARFGDDRGYRMFTHRLKTGGKSSSTKNFITLEIPEDGRLRVAVRTGSNSATDRNLVIMQGDEELFNQVIEESQAIQVREDTSEVKVYPYVEVAVAAGEVVLSYPTGSLNFYAFAFKAGFDSDAIEISMRGDYVEFYDFMETDGLWVMTGENDQYAISLGSKVFPETPGYYEVNELDPDFSWYVDRAHPEDTIGFIDGAIELALALEDHQVLAYGRLVDEKNQLCDIFLVYSGYFIPELIDTVVVVIPNATVSDDYVASSGVWLIYGTDDNTNVNVQFGIMADELAGRYSIQDVSEQFTEIESLDGMEEIYNLEFNMRVENNEIHIYADALCNSDIFYQIIMTVPFYEGFENVNTDGKAVKTIQNGHLFIKKSDRIFNVMGTEIR